MSTIFLAHLSKLNDAIVNKVSNYQAEAGFECIYNKINNDIIAEIEKCIFNINNVGICVSNINNIEISQNNKINGSKIGIQEVDPYIHLPNDNFIGCYNNFKITKTKLKYICREGFISFYIDYKKPFCIDYVHKGRTNDPLNLRELINIIYEDHKNINLPGMGDDLSNLQLNNFEIDNKHFINVDGDGILV